MFFRHPRTQQERRESVSLPLDASAHDYRIRLRPARTAKKLPTSYDDISNVSTDRSWKRNRRTKWKKV